MIVVDPIRVLFFTVLVLSVAFAVLGFLHHPRWFWGDALNSYIASFMMAFSLGLFTLLATFIFLTLVLGNELGWLDTIPHSLAIVALGTALWALLISFVDDAWLFLPVSIIFKRIFG